MYEARLGCHEPPFTLVPDPRYFFASRGHREALDHLLYAIRRGEGFVVVTGEVGIGKTTLCRMLLRQVDPDVETAVVLNPPPSEEELLQTILGDLGIPLPPAASRKRLLDALNGHLLTRRAAGKRVVLVVDEAQNLPARVLEQVRLLSNLETEREKLVQIVLVGQVELSAKLAQPSLRQLNQRITVRYRIRPLSAHETRAYVQHRLTLAGAQRHDLFSTPALRLIHRRSGGIPRLVNVICDRALVAMYARRLPRVRRATIHLAIGSLYPRWDPARRALPGVAGARRLAAATAFAVAGVAAGTVVALAHLP